tara:strand:- start:125 stop:496 length:372 start_codon:yes stop_codon:yes gene_type:complete
MNFLRHIFGTVSAQNYEETDTDDYNDGTLTAQDVQFADKNLLCERMIIDEIDKEGRLLVSVSRALRKYFGDKTVTRTIRRLYMRKHRGNCSVKAKQEQVLHAVKPVIEEFFKKKKDSEWGNTI